MNTISKTETVLKGRWIEKGSTVIQDDVCKRIDYLVSSVLEELGVNELNWSVLYKDPNDQRYWELTFPESSLHGGGPPELKVIDPIVAKRRYGI